MATLLTVRADLKTRLEAALGDAYTVASNPREQVILPAAVIVPADPWWVPTRLGSSPTERVEVRVEVHCLVVRGEVDEGFADLETMGVAVGVALTSAAPAWRWIDMSAPQQVEVGDIPAVFTRVAAATVV